MKANSAQLHARNLRRNAIASLDPNTRQVVPASRRSVAEVVRFLGKVKERAAILNPFGQGAKIGEWADAALNAVSSDDWLKEKGQIAFAAAHGDKEAAALHAAAVEVTTENVVRANSNWLPFFESRSLGEEEFPVINPNTFGMQIAVDTIGQDGGNRTIQAQLGDPAPIFVPLYMRATNWIEYPLVDAYHGSKVKDLALSQFDVARDRAWRTDALLGSYILFGGANTRLVETFVTTGANALRDYEAHDRVIATNLPTGNFVTLSGNSTTTKFRKEVFDAILEYCAAWGDNVMEGGNLNPVEITVASSHVTGFLSQVSMTSADNPLTKQVFEGGAVMSYAGRTWIITGNNTIDPNAGIAYVRMDQPVGIVYDKPSLAKAITDESPALLAANKGRVCETWCEGFGMPRHWRKRMFGVCYKTAV